jgi:TPR repeat protein
LGLTAQDADGGLWIMMAGLVIGLVLLLATPASADFQGGCAAFDRGDYAAARQQWAPLAAQGDPKAQFRLGCLYAFGQGVPKDYAFALRLYRLAAEQGDADAQNNLGGMYAEGMGVPADPVQAYMWFELAAERGQQMAQKNRAFIARSMSEEQIATAQKLAYQWRARHP